MCEGSITVVERLLVLAVDVICGHAGHVLTDRTATCQNIQSQRSSESAMNEVTTHSIDILVCQFGIYFSVV